MKKYLLVAFFFTYLSSCKEKNQPNIVFISIDDFRKDLTEDIIYTPNLDKLSSDASVFTNHYVQVPTCGASRQALLTGMRPISRRHLKNSITAETIAIREEEEHPETFIHHLKRNGYYTLGIGKISHSADGLVYGYEEKPSSKKELPYSWSELVFNAGQWKTGWNAFFAYANGENRQSMKKQVKPYEVGEVDDDGYPDGLSTKLALEKLTELKLRKQPFFLGLGFFKPHLPFNSPKKYWDLYDKETINVTHSPNIPENISTKSLQRNGEFNQYLLGDEFASLAKPVSNEYARKLRHAYYASTSYIDAQVGLVIDKLKTEGLYDNTVIVIWGDHGWHLGDQRVWGKHTLFDNALRSQLIIKPVTNLAPSKIESIVESIDIYPSLIDMCNLTPPKELDGESFVPLLNNELNNYQNVAYSYFNNGISLRTPQYRLTKYFRDELPLIELYDHDNDPFETINIAQDKPDIVNQLLPMLEKGNTGLYEINSN
jgi:arylsulfatase A-like enzyme